MNTPETLFAMRSAAKMPSAACRVKEENPANTTFAPATFLSSIAAGSPASTPLSSTYPVSRKAR